MNPPITAETWASIAKMYLDGASLNTCASVFQINHQAISEKLKSLGIFRDRACSLNRSVIHRRKFVKPGKFEHIK